MASSVRWDRRRQGAARRRGRGGGGRAAPTTTRGSAERSPAAAAAARRIVVEATGGYERPLVAALATAGLPVAVVNPRQVRDFARATGQLAKTDADRRPGARPVRRARCGPSPGRCPRRGAQALAALVARRRQLAGDAHRRAQPPAQARAAVRARASSSTSAGWSRSWPTSSRSSRAPSQPTPRLAEKRALLQSVPGVGPVLGRDAARRAARARAGWTASRSRPWSGVAPLNRDSGTLRGRRRSGAAGRRCARPSTWPRSSAPGATPCSAPSTAAARRGQAAKKLALTACMRKLLVILNAIVRSGVAWSPTHPPEDSC